jgi:lauroyl/myristoyl acyltransferase
LDSNDIYQVAIHVYADLVARLFGESQWQKLARWGSSATSFIQPGKMAIRSNRVATVFPDRLPGNMTPAQLVATAGMRAIEDKIMMRRVAQRPDWRPEIHLLGAEVVAERLKRNGVMLWAAPSTSLFNLLPMIAHDEGWPRNRLSVWFHGPSKTRFGLTVINPRLKAVENRYARRIVLTQNIDRAAFAKIYKALTAREVVMVNATSHGLRIDEFPCLGGQITLALGGIKLGLKAGASIITVTLNRGQDVKFNVHFRPIAEPDDQLSPLDVGQRMAELIAAAMQENPCQWRVSDEQIHA